MPRRMVVLTPVGGREAMRVAVMGSGGVGGYFGARLAKGGADVAFVARGAHLAAMREHGLAVTGPDAFQLRKSPPPTIPRPSGSSISSSSPSSSGTPSRRSPRSSRWSGPTPW